MTDWVDDPWIAFAGEMLDEFAQKHEATLPRDWYEVWNEVELTYFCLSFAIWNAEQKFSRKARGDYNRRAMVYRENARSWIESFHEIENPDDEAKSASFDNYTKREQEYTSLLIRGAGSLFSVIGGSTFKPACQSFVFNTCKNHVYPLATLVKIICPWLLDKGVQFKQQVSYE
jgi:hypothetical protein